MVGKRIAVSLVAGLCALGALAGPALASTPGTLALGINADNVFAMAPSAWDTYLSGMAAAHVQVVRETAGWESVEPNAPGADGPQYNWAYMDSIAAALATYHMRWLPVIAYSTDWSASYDTSSGLIFKTYTPDIYSPPVPADYGDFADYAAAFVARYGPGGAFWKANPSLTPEPVTEIQIWNEPNVTDFWNPAPNASEYGLLYEDARSAIKAVDPSAEVAVGALGNPAGTFIDQMVEALGSGMPIDAVADTPYGDTEASVISLVGGLRYALDAEGYVTTPIEVSEFGWPTSGTAVNWTAVMSDANRAQALTQTLQALGTGDCGVDLITPYTWVSAQQNTNSIYDWFGIVNVGGGATQSSAAYTTELAKLEALQPTAYATSDTCYRPFDVTATRVGTTAGTTCIEGDALAYYHIGVAGSTIDVAATDSSSGQSWTGTATTGSNGLGTVCLSIPSGTPLSVTVRAYQPYFVAAPATTITTTAT